MNLEEAEVIGQRRIGELLYVENTINLLHMTFLMNVFNVWCPDLLMSLRPAGWISLSHSDVFTFLMILRLLSE